ncbi:MAG: UDP-N-acetylmuramoyl-L-alanyl-D-glutamate--2,6-diaminopimelate ligase [Chloroflexi bacterium]|nr:UDP-N-acetylmuramoyl-L-alanyl-D-glutamate--2,6-diaminopimelate ligase [Chloroflexota bacterium]MQC25387.1 UDP-N-acetylmuramoyl-L-alanyl-D-glutamate--2,6-diaminopimelate ligase [Chloroflexota bacterium]
MDTDSAPTPAARGDWRDGLPEGVDRASLPAIRAVQFDSRDVTPGDLFVCISGERADGHDFASQAVRSGAVALIAEAGRGGALQGLGVPVVEVATPRAVMASAAAAHEGYPARSLKMIGVTGTDGKSTTSFLLHAALSACGLKTGLLTTIESKIADRVLPNPTRLTSQEAPVVQRMLAEMLAEGCTHAVVEATSIGLDLHRLDHCALDVAVFTNLTPDHLDFHGDLQKYRAAKGRLFELLDATDRGKKRRGTAVLNRDDPAWHYMASRTRARVVTYALDDDEADVTVEDLMQWPDGSTFALSTGEESLEASIRLPGRFNVANAAAAVTAAAALGLNAMQAAAGIAACEGVPGRMQRIDGAPFTVIVDYAHTADALAKVVETVRPAVEGRVIVVFGCAGERGMERRTGLGGVAARVVDYAVLTDEDPRSEPSDAIIDDIARAMLAAGAVEGEHFERIPDRRAAIARALNLAQPADLVLLAGKGHESTIEYADGPRPWDDRETARELIAERFGGPPI